jgi:hypothetical protein
MGFIDVLGIKHLEQIADKIIEAKWAMPTGPSPVPLIEADDVEIFGEPGNHSVPHPPARSQ